MLFPEAFNVKPGKVTYTSDLAKLLLSNPRVRRKDIVYAKGRDDDVQDSLASIGKASGVLGYVLRVGIGQGLTDFLKRYLDRWREVRCRSGLSVFRPIFRNPIFAAPHFASRSFDLTVEWCREHF